MNPLALLKLIPLKDWIYAGLIATLLIWFGIHNHNEREAGAMAALQPVAVLAQKAKTQVAVGTAVAQTTESSNAKTYDEAVAALPVPGVDILCYNAHRGSSQLPEAGAVPAPGTGGQPTDGGAGPAFDPSGPLLERAHKADAQIVYLQGRVHQLEAQMRASP